MTGGKNMEKVVVYSVSRNIYELLVPSLNSLLNNGGVDKVYVLAEDDNIGLRLPDTVHVINVSAQTWFRKDGPNYNSNWTYMAMMQIPLSKIFPNLDRVLSLDFDTIVKKDISDLWDLNMDDYYYAGVPEPALCKDGYVYVNAGVVMWNLKKMREGKADEIIRALNTKQYKWIHQECMNELCQGHILTISNEYNVNLFTSIYGPVRIRHFAAEGNTWFVDDPLVQMYKG